MIITIITIIIINYNYYNYYTSYNHSLVSTSCHQDPFPAGALFNRGV